MDKTPTPLLSWLRLADDAQRERLATLAGTKVGYLYLLATCERKNPGAKMALGIEDATRQMHEETGGKLPIVTVRTMASMCAVKDFTEARQSTPVIDSTKL